MEYLIIGKNGQLGKELSNLLKIKGINFTAVSSKELDITDEKAVNDYFENNMPKVIFDCAAYTNVEGAEDEPGKTLNHQVNYLGTKNVAEAAEKISATLVYISTDYVFDGKSKNEYSPISKTHPMNEYGKEKLKGEDAIREICSKYYIIRTSWLYGKYGNNFVYTMLKLSESHDELSVVSDQVGRPTWSKTLAEFMLFAVSEKIPYGTYQLSNDGKATWYDFAKYILKNKNVKINPVDSNAFPQKAYRPQYSVMSLDKVKESGFKIPDWKTALDDFLNNL